MSYPINYPTPQSANVQIFQGGDSRIDGEHTATRDWIKPQGASFVFFTLIGGGGGGGGNYYGSSPGDRTRGGGGASGNVTNFMCPAFLIPDVLQVSVGRGGAGAAWAGADVSGASGSSGQPSQIIHQPKTGSGYVLINATGGGGGGGGVDPSTAGGGGTRAAADVGGPMTAAGFYSNTRGQNGASNAEITVDNLTFLLGGSGGTDTNEVTGYYGYKATPAVGYGQIQPIIQSISGGLKKSPFGAGGCGANPDLASGFAPAGGDGMVIIITW